MKTVLITGASSGIGADLAKVFAEKGYGLILVARSTDKLQDLTRLIKQKFDVNAIALPEDLSTPQSAQKLFNEIEQLQLKVDVLINNAGMGHLGEFVKQDFASVEKMLHLNMTTLTLLCRLFGAQMAERGEGHIVNLASTAAFQAGPFMSLYYASKAFVLSFSEGLYAELKGRGVGVTASCPGPTQTEFFRAANMGSSNLVKLPHMMTSEQVAHEIYSAVRASRPIVIHGLTNKILAWATRLTPRFILRWFVAKLHGSHY